MDKDILRVAMDSNLWFVQWDQGYNDMDIHMHALLHTHSPTKWP